MKKWLIVLVLLTLLAHAQEVKTPKLTNAQIAALQIHFQKVEIAQLRLQLVQNELQQARDAAQALFQSLQVEGYTLDLNKMAYVPKPKPKPE